MSILNSNGLIKANALHNTLELSDGSLGVPIVYHNVKLGSNLFSSSDDFSKYIYHNEQCWCNFPAINQVTRPASGYEILVLQQNSGSDTFTTYRWSQTVSPLSATGSQVNPSSGNITHYDGTSYGGMYVMNDTVYMCFANTSNGNGFGCAHKNLGGGTAGTNGYIPGYDGAQVYGGQNVYIRVSKTSASMRSTVIEANDFIEY